MSQDTFFIECHRLGISDQNTDTGNLSRSHTIVISVLCVSRISTQSIITITKILTYKDLIDIRYETLNLYEQDAFGGEETNIVSDLPNLPSNDDNKRYSAIVTGCTPWTIYEYVY